MGKSDQVKFLYGGWQNIGPASLRNLCRLKYDRGPRPILEVQEGE